MLKPNQTSGPRRERIRTAEQLPTVVDEVRLKEMFLRFEEFGDYERRLMQAKLAEMNRGAKGLPPLALEQYGIKSPWTRKEEF